MGEAEEAAQEKAPEERWSGPRKWGRLPFVLVQREGTAQDWPLCTTQSQYLNFLGVPIPASPYWAGSSRCVS